ncbi:trigger factor [Aggregatilinea lenta]|uniref:trigger factor n=1 Tax=Aggregatilinea lenta TaxID=913108 RepID=UPI0013C32B2D|nr:trigger factor [Aggregatilinea lenta]
MNIQTEHLDNHTARLTVDVDPARVESALRTAARRLSKKGRIPGFRPGKAPLNVILNLYGREYVLGEAIDELGNDIYREALDQADITPFAPGSLEDFKEEDGLKLTFVVPKQPTVDLGGYRDAVRAEYSVEEIADDAVEKAMEGLRESKSVLEDVERPAEMSDLVTLGHVAIFRLDEDSEDAEEIEEEESAEAEEAENAEAVDEAESSDEADDAEDADEDEDLDDEDFDDEDFDEHDHDHEEDESEMIMHEHDYQAVLRDDENDLFPGFSQELVGATAGDELEFTLTLPEDYAEDEELAGATLRIEAHVAKVQSRQQVEWTDELAAEISEGEHTTISDLRADVRRRLEEASKQQAENDLIETAMDQLVEGATILYPPDLVDEYVDAMIEEFDMSLRRSGLNLEDFLKITGQPRDAVAAQYREPAVRRAQRALALSELVHQEEISLSAEELDAELDRMSQQMGGDQAEQLRALLNTDVNRSDISNRLVSERALARLAAIARGENPPQAEAAAEPAAEQADEAIAEADTASEPAVVEEAAPVADAEQPAEDAEPSE